ncbi:MAG TPA: hypothetical protein PKD98_24555 [Anaerolineae bacterium]|nr:hypothetical protein [Anaerolineae bacterium]
MSALLQPRKNRVAFYLTATAILLLAFFLRFYHLADYPLGLFFDPAINGLDAIRLMERGGPVLFFPTNGGREALFIYLLIPFIWLFETTPFAIRLLTASLSLLTVAFLFAFLRDLATGQLTTNNEQLAISNEQLTTSPSSSPPPFHPSTLPFFSTLLLATLYWHIAVSRLGQRPIMVPLIAVPFFWFFLKGWATGRKRWFILSGSLLGLAGYTYPAARLLPLILGLALLPELVSLYRRSSLGRYLPGLLLLIATAALVYAPMAWYLVNHPAQFTDRAGSVMVWNFLETPTAIVAELGRNVGRVAAFFCCAGSPNAIFGWPGYPGLSLWLTPFLLLGLGFALRSWRQLFYRLVALWWLIGIAPSIIAIEAPHPLRMIVAIPPTAILTGLGLTLASGWLQRWLSFSPGTRAPGSGLQKRSLKDQESLIPLSLAVLLILLPLPGLFRAYYLDWGRLPVTQGIYDYGAIAIRDAIARADPATPIYLPQPRFNAPTLLYYLSGRYDRQAGRTVVPTESALVISAEQDAQATSWIRLHDQTATVLPPLTEPGQALLQAALAGPSTPIQTPRGETVARLARLESDPARFIEQPAQNLAATFGPLRLVGASYPFSLDPQANVPVTLYWQAVAPTSSEYEILVRLVNDTRQAVGNGDARPTDWVYPTSFWRPGLDEVGVRHTVKLDRRPLAPGRYWLAVSVFEPARARLLPLTNTGGESPDTLYLGPLKVPLSPPAAQPLPPVKATFGDSIRLTGFRLEPLIAAPGDSLQVDLAWEVLAPPPLDYTVFLHLLNANGDQVGGSDAQPLSGQYPTSIWTPGERLLDPHPLNLPPDLPPGQYRLALGLYHQPTGERLSLRLPDGSSLPDHRLELGPFLTLVPRAN